MKKLISIFCMIAFLFTSMPAFAALDNRSFTITRENVPLKSIIDTKYNGFEYKLKNNTKQKFVLFF